ncbi:hypothetical protein Tco_0359400 [Tanacetum coccineum]
MRGKCNDVPFEYLSPMLQGYLTRKSFNYDIHTVYHHDKGRQSDLPGSIDKVPNTRSHDNVVYDSLRYGVSVLERQQYRHGVLAKEKMEAIGTKALIFIQAHHQAAKGMAGSEAGLGDN